MSENEHLSTIGQIGNSNELLLQCKCLQLFQCPVKDIQVNFFFNTGHGAYIGMLPKVPFAFIAHGIYIIVSYPIRISIENGIYRKYKEWALRHNETQLCPAKS